MFFFVESRIPYYISVVAINQIGEGKSATAIVFTKPESKTFILISIYLLCLMCSHCYYITN